MIFYLIHFTSSFGKRIKRINLAGNPGLQCRSRPVCDRRSCQGPSKPSGRTGPGPSSFPCQGFPMIGRLLFRRMAISLQIQCRSVFSLTDKRLHFAVQRVCQGGDCACFRFLNVPLALLIELDHPQGNAGGLRELRLGETALCLRIVCKALFSV